METNRFRVPWIIPVVFITTTATCVEAYCGHIKGNQTVREGRTVELPCFLEDLQYDYKSWFKGCFYETDHGNKGGLELFSQFSDTEPHRKKGAREDMEVGPNFSLVINEASPDDEEFFTCYGHIIGNTNVQKHFFAYNWLDVKSVFEWPLPTSDMIALAVGVSVGIILLVAMIVGGGIVIKKKIGRSTPNIRSISAGFSNDNYEEVEYKLD